MMYMKSRLKRLCAAALCICLLLPAVSVNATAADPGGRPDQAGSRSLQAGWIQSGDQWWYRDQDGSYPKDDWKLIGNVWYYFDKEGWMVTGWQTIKGSDYYFDSDGHMKIGWQWIDGKCYYLQASGALEKDAWIGEYYVDSSGVWIPEKQKEGKTAGWVQEGSRWKYVAGDGSYVKSRWESVKGSWYYFDADGWMQTGWQKIGGSWYYMESSGRMATGWQKIGGIWYYMESSGRMVTGWQKVGGSWYYMNGSGHMLTGWQWAGGKCYYLNPSGAMAADTWVGEYYVDSSGAWVQEKTQEAKWVKSGNRWWYQEKDGSYPKNCWKLIKNDWYYFDAGGWMQTGWQKISGSWYYMEESGRMLTGWQKINGSWYYMNPSGQMLAGWQKITGDWYYMNPSGQMLTGWQKITGDWYYMNPSGQMLTGWQKITGDWYYMNGSGQMLTGWQMISGAWYYMNGSGRMLTGWQQIGGSWYYLKDAGQMAIGWLELDGAWYYLEPSGRMVTGWQTIDEYKYHFYSNGVMAKSTSVDGISINGNGKAMVTLNGKRTIRSLLENALVPVGQTMYIYGGGHDGSKGGDAVRIGVNPQWKTFYDQQDSSYDFTKYRYKHGYGLDCSGLVGWTLYNTFNTEANKQDYSSTSTLMPQMLADRGLGTCSTVSGAFQAGDVVSKAGHTWIILGTCSDGSVVLIHSTPPVVQISGTVTPQGVYDSEAVALARTYMNRYYQDAATRFRLSSCDKSYLNNVSRLRWSGSTLSDPDEFQGMSAPDILKKIFGE